MKNFVIKVIGFFLVLAISVLFLFQKRSSVVVDKFKNISSTYDVVNLGTSHGGGVKYANINGQGFERAGNTLYYDLQNYKYIKPYLNPGAVIIIPLSYFSFGLDENRTDNSDPTAFTNEFYFYLPTESIYNYSFKKNIAVYFNKAKINYNSIINERFFRKPKNVKATKISKETQLKNHAASVVPSHKKMGVYSSPEKNMKYLVAMINNIQESGFKPILITTPYSKSYNDEFGEEWLQRYYYKYINLVLDQKDIPYFNYSRDIRFEEHSEMFHNSDHFNLAGANYFSDILFSDLKELGLLKNYNNNQQKD